MGSPWLSEPLDASRTASTDARPVSSDTAPVGCLILNHGDTSTRWGHLYKKTRSRILCKAMPHAASAFCPSLACHRNVWMLQANPERGLLLTSCRKSSHVLRPSSACHHNAWMLQASPGRCSPMPSCQRFAWTTWTSRGSGAAQPLWAHRLWATAWRRRAAATPSHGVTMETAADPRSFPPGPGKYFARRARLARRARPGCRSMLPPHGQAETHHMSHERHGANPACLPLRAASALHALPPALHEARSTGEGCGGGEAASLPG